MGAAQWASDQIDCREIKEVSWKLENGELVGKEVTQTDGNLFERY
jgi:hypothetical protein